MTREERKSPANSGNKYTPGPGTYNYKSTIGEGAKMGMSPKLSGGKASTIVPGPGTYDPKKEVILENKGTIGMPHCPRSGIGIGNKQGQTPGPGAYSTAETNLGGPKYSIGTGPRTKLEGNKNSPG